MGRMQRWQAPHLQRPQPESRHVEQRQYAPSAAPQSCCSAPSSWRLRASDRRAMPTRPHGSLLPFTAMESTCETRPGRKAPAGRRSTRTDHRPHHGQWHNCGPARRHREQVAFWQAVAVLRGGAAREAGVAGFRNHHAQSGADTRPLPPHNHDRFVVTKDARRPPRVGFDIVTTIPRSLPALPRPAESPSGRPRYRPARRCRPAFGAIDDRRRRPVSRS